MNQTSRIVFLSALACCLLACGGGNDAGESQEPVANDPYAGEPRLEKGYRASVEKEQPPSIRLTLQLRRDGTARLMFQHGAARAFREERGSWRRERGTLFFERDPELAEFSGSIPTGKGHLAGLELPEVMQFSIGPKVLALMGGVVGAGMLEFQAIKRP